MSCLTAAVIIFSLVKLSHGTQSSAQLQISRDREVFFNKTSYIKLQSLLSFHNNIGISFRTCSGGQIFAQSSSTFKNKISLEVTSEFLTLLCVHSSKPYETKINDQFLNDEWHEVNISSKSGSIILTIDDYHHQVIANATHNPELLSPEVTLFDRSSKLIIGEGFIGCLAEGPSLPFNSSTNEVNNIEWGSCPPQTGSCSLCAKGNNLCQNNARCEEDEMGNYVCVCEHGYTGIPPNCTEMSSCASSPCLNGGVCSSISSTDTSFNCSCPPGFTGKLCQKKIDECQSNPCQNAAVCIDTVNGYVCNCPSGYTGVNCETDIDECKLNLCKNGHCLNSNGSYQCFCTPGYTGDHCELDIDECLSHPCLNGASCVSAVNRFNCICAPGFTGKNCEEDINECESNPCQSGGTCIQKSDLSLFNKRNLSSATVPQIDSQNFSAVDTYGYECVCPPGFSGSNCELDVNECENHHCRNGACKDGIGSYTCECEEGFEGTFCEIDIDECERYKPCINGACFDRRAGYFCECTPKYGGKNCSVELIGCNQEPACLNNGTCKPYLIGETLHKFNCTCPNGFHGATCEKITTMSLNGESHIVVNTSRDEGYDISFRFKTTLPSGLLALGKGSTFYILELVNGRLNLHSSLLNKWEGVFIGSQLNDSNWQKVFVAINSSHVVLAANEEQTIYPINFNEGGTTSQTSFPTTYVGGTVQYLRHLTHGPSVFIGCTENIVINGQWVIPEETTGVPVEMQGVEVGCQRRDQCHPNPCHSGGVCTDLWKNFSCSCQRPYLGNTCQYNLTAATFGHENITNSLVTVSIFSQAKKAVRNIVDISMFIRTRQQKGAIFYLGSFPGLVGSPEETHITAELDSGELLVRIQFNGTLESYTVNGVKLNDGHNHLIEVIRNVTLIQVKINETEYFRKTISASGLLDAQVLYLGGFPAQTSDNETLMGSDTSTVDLHRDSRDAQLSKLDTISNDPHISRYIRQTAEFDNMPHYKGVIQDVQISNGSLKMVVEFFPLKVKDLVIPKLFGNVSFDPATVLEGVLSDNACLSNPCFNNAVCNVTWNDFICHCTLGYKGKQCQEMEFCQLQDCPVGSECRNLHHGYECVANITMNGVASNTSLAYTFVNNTETAIPFNSIEIMYRSKTGGTLLYLCNNEETSPQKHLYFSVFVFNDIVTIAWKLDQTVAEQFHKIKKEHPDGEWTNIVIKIIDNKIHGSFSGAVDEPGTYFSSSNFSSVAWNNLATTGNIYIGGGDSFLEETLLSEKHSYIFEGESVNAIDFSMPDFVSNTEEPVVLPSSNTRIFSGIFYKGCIGEIRIGGLLLPYFTTSQLNGSTHHDRNYFIVNQPVNKHNVDYECYLCFAADCKNGGKCSNLKESYNCDCAPGFNGEDCSHDIDECINNKCQHGATCKDGIANYTCHCTTGWSGWQCDVDINECESKPCQNGGTCIDKLGLYDCECPEEFIGKQCEQVKQITCENEPCKNDARCSDIPNKNTGDNFTCSCLDGFIGTYCDEKFCSVTPCRNKGLCVIKNKAPTCECQKGFTGKYCEENIDDCQIGLDDLRPCLHGGHCIDGIASYICNCTSTGYKGVRCETDINECIEGGAICGERGKCKNENGSYRCECDRNVCGYHCDLYDPCLEMPCQNGGTCREKCTNEPDYECICQPTYIGKNCTEVQLYTADKITDIVFIVGPIVFVLILALVISIVMFFMMARNKRATRGTYSPSSQEYCNPRVELDNVMKPPPEERLI